MELRRGIPGWDIICDSQQLEISEIHNGQLCNVLDDTKIINSVDFLTGKRSDAKGEEIKYIQTDSDSVYLLEIDETIYEIRGMEATNANGNEPLNVIISSSIVVEGEEAIPTATICLPNDVSECVVKTEEADSFVLNFGDSLVSANVSDGAEITFEENGTIKVVADKPVDYFLSVTTNEQNTEHGCSTFFIKGVDASNISAELQDEGLVLKGDILTDVIVSGVNNKEFSCVDFSTKESEVMIIDDIKKDLVIKIDSDDDGIYETTIEKNDELDDNQYNEENGIRNNQYMEGATEENVDNSEENFYVVKNIDEGKRLKHNEKNKFPTKIIQDNNYTENKDINIDKYQEKVEIVDENNVEGINETLIEKEYDSEKEIKGKNQGSVKGICLISVVVIVIGLLIRIYVWKNKKDE